MDITDFENENEYAERMLAEKKLLNPRVDSTFKALFTQPTAESRGALKSFLEAATEHEIMKIELLPSSAIIDYFGQRDVNYDILCTFNDGEQANIEMQAFNQCYNYGKRAEYHVAKVFASSLKKGMPWETVSKAYQISVLNFLYDSKSTDIVSRYAMRTADGRELLNMQNIVFIELPKIKDKEKNFEKNTTLENWAIFLRDADNPNKMDLIDELTKKEEGLMQAQQSLSSISADKLMWVTQFRQEVAEHDKASYEYAMKKARSDGLAEGRAEGRAKGLVEGRAEGRAEGVNNVMKLNALLIKENRFDDLKRASNDWDYLNKLLKDFNL